MDRNEAAFEAAGYATGLFKVLGADEMAKNDLIVGISQSLRPPGGQ
jgi:hypothetical protein